MQDAVRTLMPIDKAAEPVGAYEEARL